MMFNKSWLIIKVDSSITPMAGFHVSRSIWPSITTFTLNLKFCTAKLLVTSFLLADLIYACTESIEVIHFLQVQSSSSSIKRRPKGFIFIKTLTFKFFKSSFDSYNRKIILTCFWRCELCRRCITSATKRL